MQFKSLLLGAAAASLASAQDPPSLTQALSSTEELSSLNTLLGDYPDLVAVLANSSNITIFAPNNVALEALNDPNVQLLTAIPGFVEATLMYHVANASIQAANITSTPAFIPTLLTNETWSRVTGGQRVGARTVGEGDDAKVVILSGLGARANVTQADIAIANGSTVHIIDSILALPLNVSTTAIAGNLTALAGALEATNLTTPLDSASDITIFAPTNDAFGDIASALSTLSAEEAASILGYHVINGTVAYSNLFADGTSVNSSTGAALNITIDDGEVFVNQARVIAADILVSGGVIHVIDAVLNPNGTALPNPDSDDPVIAYSGATSGAVPYTSGIPTPTVTAISTTDAVAEGYTPAPTDALASASEAAASSSSSAGAAAMVTGAVGAAALFGAGAGAAWLV